MNASGALLVLAGAWVLFQVLGGNALGRLGVTGGETKPGTTESGPKIMAPGPLQGVPVPGLGG